MVFSTSLTSAFRYVFLVPPQEVETGDDQAEEADQGQVGDKLAEGEAGVGADEDVGRVADQGGGAAHVGGKGLGDQEGQGMDLEGEGDLDGHRDHQEHGGDVVQEGGNHRGEELEDEGEDKDVAPGPGVGLVSQELEHAGLFHHPHEDHHAQEQEDDVQVDGPHGVIKGENVKGLVKAAQGVGDEQDQGRGQQGRQGAVHPFEADDDVHPQENEGGEPEGRGDRPRQGKVPGGLEKPVALRPSRLPPP